MGHIYQRFVNRGRDADTKTFGDFKVIANLKRQHRYHIHHPIRSVPNTGEIIINHIQANSQSEVGIEPCIGKRIPLYTCGKLSEYVSKGALSDGDLYACTIQLGTGTIITMQITSKYRCAHIGSTPYLVQIIKLDTSAQAEVLRLPSLFEGNTKHIHIAIIVQRIERQPYSTANSGPFARIKTCPCPTSFPLQENNGWLVILYKPRLCHY